MCARRGEHLPPSGQERSPRPAQGKQPGPGRRRPPSRPRAHSPRGRSCPLFPCAPQLARVRLPARGSQPSRRSGETMRVTARLPETRARGAPPLPSPSPLLVFRTFCLPKPKSLTHPSQLQPLSPLSPSSSLLGAALASGEQLVAHSSPRLGEGGGGLGSAPPPSALRPEALGAGRGTTATKQARNGSPSSSAAPVSIRAPRLTGSRPHGDLRTGEHGPPSPLIRPRPLARLAPPLQGISSAHSAGPPGPYATPPAGAQPSADPSPRFRKVRPRAAGAPRPHLRPGPAHSAPRAAAGSGTGGEGGAPAATSSLPASPPRCGRGS